MIYCNIFFNDGQYICSGFLPAKITVNKNQVIYSIDSKDIENLCGFVEVDIQPLTIFVKNKFHV